MRDTTPLRELLDFAVAIAHEAGRTTLGYYQAEFQVELKPDASPVTEADKRAEEVLRERIARRFPDHAIVGEEYGASGSEGAAVRWILDPIDGTKSFVHGVPLYATLVGVEVEGEPVAGAAYFPALDEMLAAARGLGTSWNGRRCRVSDTARLADATVCYTSVRGYERTGRKAVHDRLIAATATQRGWSDAYAHALVATGRVDVAIEPGMNLWDNAPLLPIVVEAGGAFTDWTGAARIDGGDAVATNGRLHPEVLALIAAERRKE